MPQDPTMSDGKPLLSYTRALTLEQAEKLRTVLTEKGFAFEPKEWTLYSARRDKLIVSVYEKGPKVLIQGRGITDFVAFTLEPEVVGRAELGYEEVLQPDMFAPHFGIDESGKGDFFGPLVIAGVYVNPEIARALRKFGVADSKLITTDEAIRQTAKKIRSVPGIHSYILSLGPEKYNELYLKCGSVNLLLAWAHAEVITVLRRYVPECPRALSDQFAHPSVLQRALDRRRLVKMQLDQKTKGESDIAVAAASVLARERFIDWMDEVSRRLSWRLPRGATSVKKEAAQLVTEKGEESLIRVAKVHFKTTAEVIGKAYPGFEGKLTKKFL
jgi:ribonuclease HIII